MTETREGRASVCVIGAGIAGLVTAKVFGEDGFDVTVFEKESALGGTWAAARSYPGLRTNNCKYTYAFSDFPYPESVDVYPQADQVRRYLESYADHFGIRSRINFDRHVSRIARSSAGGDRYEIVLQPTGGGAEQSAEFDFVVVCNGVFHLPHMPTIEGMSDFAGRIVASCDVTDAIYEQSKHPIVVGGGKSALDSATGAAKRGLSPTLVFRHPHWIAPRFLPGGIPGDFVILLRLTASTLRYHELHGIDRFLQTVGKPLSDLWWTFVSFIFPKILGMPRELTPDPLPHDLERFGVGGEFFDEFNAGRAKAVAGEIKRFKQNSVELTNGKEIPADLVIFATGWEQDMSFLADDLREEIVHQGRFRLYRHLLPPTAQRIGFVGYASSVAAQLTAEIGAHWLSQCFLGALSLPSVEDMEQEIDRVHAWAAETMPSRRAGYFVGAFVPQYVDDLVRDMGLPTKRTGNFIKEYLTPFFASRFSNLGEERRRSREGLAALPRGFYFSGVHAGIAALVIVLVLWW